MSEIRSIIDNKTFSYTGLISVQGLYRSARTWLEENGYTPYEKHQSQQIFEDGLQIYVEMDGEKKLSDYAKIGWETHFTFLKCEEVVVEKEGRKVKMYKGEVQLRTEVFLITDYDLSFEQSAFQYFLRVVIDKYVFKSYIYKAEKAIKTDYKSYELILKSFLNMERFH